MEEYHGDLLFGTIRCDVIDIAPDDPEDYYWDDRFIDGYLKTMIVSL